MYAITLHGVFSAIISTVAQPYLHELSDLLDSDNPGLTSLRHNVTALQMRCSPVAY